MFGGVERTGKRRLFGEVVKDRTARTLLEVIKRRVANGSIIYSDMWVSYNGIEKELKMEHYSVNHTKYFKDPVTGVHTNTIEGTWNGIKMAIKPRSRSRKLLEDNIQEFVWRRMHKDNLWDSFIYCLKNYAVYN